MDGAVECIWISSRRNTCASRAMGNAHPSIHYRRAIHPSVPSISPRSRGHSHFAKQSSFPFITSSADPPLLFYLSALPLPDSLLRSVSLPFFPSETLRLQLVSFAFRPPSSLFSPVSPSSSRPTDSTLPFAPGLRLDRAHVFSCFTATFQRAALSVEGRSESGPFCPTGVGKSHWPKRPDSNRQTLSRTLYYTANRRQTNKPALARGFPDACVYLSWNGLIAALRSV